MPHSTKINTFSLWKKSTERALLGTGYDRILNNKKFARANPNMSSTVFAQLSLTVVQGFANHVVKQVKKTKDGYETRHALTAWYKEADHETLDALQTKITRLYLHRLQTYNGNLHGINNGKEKYSDRTKVRMFLKHIRDLYYKTVIEVIKNQTGQGSLKLIQAIAWLRKCKLELIQVRKSKRRFGSPWRKKGRMEEDSDDNYPTAKITPEHKRPTPTPGDRSMNLQQQDLHLEARMDGSIWRWPNFHSGLEQPSQEQRENWRLGFTKLVPSDGDFKKEKRICWQVEQLGSKVKTPAMKEKDNKKIYHHRKNQFHGAKEPIDDDLEWQLIFRLGQASSPLGNTYHPKHLPNPSPEDCLKIE
jgi:hypothetical protein